MGPPRERLPLSIARPRAHAREPYAREDLPGRHDPVQLWRHSGTRGMRALSGTALTRTHVDAVGSLALALSGRPAQSWAVRPIGRLTVFIVGARGITTE